MIDPLRNIRQKLAHHLTAEDDPCQDRGVSWPCDVADALGPDADADVLQMLGEFCEDDEDPAAVAAAFEAGEKGLTKSTTSRSSHSGNTTLAESMSTASDVVELTEDVDCCARAAGRRTRGGPDHCGLCGKPFKEDGDA